MSLVFVLASLLGSAEPKGLTARSALVVDIDSGEVLYRRGPSRAVAIASISKLMAIQVVLGRGLDLEEQTEIIPADVQHTRGGARSRLQPGTALPNRDLLHAALLGSDNRAVLALGRAVGLSREALTAAMNRRAAELGLSGMRFAEPTGISHDNVASPTALVGLLTAAAGQPDLAAITQKATYTTSGRTVKRQRLVYSNTDAFAHGETLDVLVGKTGFNSAAGWCVALVAKVHGRRLAFVVLGASSKSSRFGDVRRIRAWLERQGLL